MSNHKPRPRCLVIDKHGCIEVFTNLYWAILIAKQARDVKEKINVKVHDIKPLLDLLKAMGLPASIRFEEC